MRKFVITAVAALVALVMVGFASTSAQAASYSTQSNCLNGASKYAGIGVAWDLQPGTMVKPTQVRYAGAVYPVTRFEVSWYRTGIYSQYASFSQTGQLSQTHNWTVNSYGEQASSYVYFVLTFNNGRKCTGRVRAVAG